MSKTILIYIEKENEVSSELAKKAQELADKMGDTEVAGIFIGDYAPSGDSYFDKIYYIDNENFRHYSSELYPYIMCELISDLKPEIILIGATSEGRNLAPQVSASLRTGLTADCIELDINNEGKLEATRPTFGGKLMATIRSKSTPQMATVRPKVIKTNFNTVLKNTEYIKFESITTHLEQQIKLLNIIKKENNNSLEDAEIIVAAGKGMKDNLDLVKEFAEKINAKFGVSRALVDLGLADASMQVGQTGKTVSPKLYIACGISGTIQHTVGIMGAEKIIAINKDKDAPIFKLADFGIVGDAVEILKEMTKGL